jgi:hypothetical protein
MRRVMREVYGDARYVRVFGETKKRAPYYVLFSPKL